MSFSPGFVAADRSNRPSREDEQRGGIGNFLGIIWQALLNADRENADRAAANRAAGVTTTERRRQPAGALDLDAGTLLNPQALTQPIRGLEIPTGRESMDRLMDPSLLVGGQSPADVVGRPGQPSPPGPGRPMPGAAATMPGAPGAPPSLEPLGPATAQAVPETLLPSGNQAPAALTAPPAGNQVPGGWNPLDSIGAMMGGIFGGSQAPVDRSTIPVIMGGPEDFAARIAARNQREARLAAGLDKPSATGIAAIRAEPMASGSFTGGGFQGGTPEPGQINEVMRPGTAGPATTSSELAAILKSPTPGTPSSPALQGIGGAGSTGNLSSLTNAIMGRAGSEGTLAQYQADPEFAIEDIFGDAGIDSRRNIYADYVTDKWGDVLDDFAFLAEQVDPKGKAGAYGRFLESWAGGANPGNILTQAVQLAQTDTPEGKAVANVLASVEPATLAKMIAATTGESPMSASARARTMSDARLQARRQAQARAQTGNLDPDSKEWLQYLLGEVR